LTITIGVVNESWPLGGMTMWQTLPLAHEAAAEFTCAPISSPGNSFAFSVAEAVVGLLDLGKDGEFV
jgi:hypothetical protein